MALIRFALTAAALCAALSFAGCVPAKDDCNDGVDNDGDGRIDGADPACASGSLEAPDPGQCADGVDNDGDLLIDSADPGCSGPGDTTEADAVGACNDAVDNDGDGKVDFPQDPGCESPTDLDESNLGSCGNGKDDDGDGKTDWPADPGCSAIDDDTEQDPSPLPQCANGLDDDGDGQTDWPGDMGCSSAGDADEYNTIQGACGVGAVADITDTGSAMVSMPAPKPNALESPTCRGQGGETGFKYTVTGGPVSLLVSTDFPETTLDTVVYVRRDCKDEGTEIGCDDDSGSVGAAGGASVLLVKNVPDGDYYVVVDSYGATSVGNFKLKVEARVPLHGACTATGTPCEPDLICREVTPGAGSTCEPHLCGDGVDNDGDGKTDYPTEPGCGDLLDDDETDPATPPVCANGLDDDMDTKIDWPDDPGCAAAGDTTETDECVPGLLAPLYAQAANGMVGAGASKIMPPTACSTSASGDERVFRFELNRDVTNLTISTAGSTVGTVVYVRPGDCAVEGPSTMCVDGFGVAADLELTAPAQGRYFVVVDTTSGSSGTVNLEITGKLALGQQCAPGHPIFKCGAGLACHMGSCMPTECNDGVDNNDPEDTVFDVADPGCTSIDDDDEVNPATLPACANGADDDGDMQIDYPNDPGCVRAGDDNEQQCGHDLCATGNALTATCDPCVAQVCAADSFCCSTSWDSICVGEVTSICGLTCP